MNSRLTKSVPGNHSPYAIFGGAFVFLLLVTAGLILKFSSLGWLTAYLAGVNFAAFCLAAFDKGIAGSSSMRVPELIFYLTALLGGSVGLLLAMKLFRHKTRKSSFQLVLAVVILLQIALLSWIYRDFPKLGRGSDAAYNFSDY